MKHIKPVAAGTIALCFATLNAVAGPSQGGGDAPPLADVKTVAGGYMQQLKSTLQEHMKSGGPEAAMGACGEKAAHLGGEVSRQSGWSVKRVSNRARNPLDMPDAYEQKVLKDFEKKITTTKDDVERYEVVKEGGVRYARYMKAIKIDTVCLACHGSEIAPGVSQRISELYPHDPAKNYKMGDLRGAVSIKIKLD